MFVKVQGLLKAESPFCNVTNTRKHVTSLDTYHHNIPKTKPEPLQFSIPIVFPFAYLPITWNEETGSPWLIRYQELLSSLWKRDTPMQDRETSYLSVFQGRFLTSQNYILSENKKQEGTHTYTKTALHSMLYAAEFYSSNLRKKHFSFLLKANICLKKRSDCKLGGLEYCTEIDF